LVVVEHLVDTRSCFAQELGLVDVGGFVGKLGVELVDDSVDKPLLAEDHLLHNGSRLVAVLGYKQPLVELLGLLDSIEELWGLPYR